MAQRQVAEVRSRRAAEAAEAAAEARRPHRQIHHFLPKHQAAMGEEGGTTRLVLAKIGPVWLTPAAAERVEENRRTPVDNRAPRVISSDGSMINAGQEDVAMAFGIVDRSNTVIRTVQGRTDGFASSAKAELMGLFAAIISAPPEQDIVVQLDNQSVVQQYQQLVKRRLFTLPRKRQRSNYAGMWAALHQVVEERLGKVEVQWVRGHAENVGNNMADMVATSAVRADTAPWSVDLSMQQDITKVAYCQNTMVEMDLRQLLKQQTTIRRHQAWTTQRRTKRALQDLDDIEWRSTLSHVHSKRAVHTFFSSAQDTRNRTHGTKKLHGMLPTMNVIHARHPDLYPDQVCCVCEIQDEDNAHIWQCSANPNVHSEIREEGLARIDGWGKTATSKYNKKAKEKH